MTSFTETFGFSYNKRKNTELFKDLETTVGISKIQNFIPIYNMFFLLVLYVGIVMVSNRPDH